MDLGKIVKKSVEKQNMLAWQFNTIGVSDGITMGSDGTSWWWCCCCWWRQFPKIPPCVTESLSLSLSLNSHLLPLISCLSSHTAVCC